MVIAKKYTLLFLLCFPIFILLSCKKTIDVNLNSSEEQIVITGEVNNNEGPYKVTISKSVNFNSPNQFPPVSGATVVIKGDGVSDTLIEKEPGDYFTRRIKGKPGKQYSLFVKSEGKIYTATSVMPLEVTLDSLTFLLGFNSNIYAVANFLDPIETVNYYQFIEYADGEPFKNGRGNLVFEDRLSNGRYIAMALYDDSTDIKPGISLTVKMKCIDPHVYKYWNELLQISGNGGGFASPTPTNPDTNISGGALGYFSANTITSRTVEIQ